MNNIKNYNETIFENIKHINEYGQEYWKARELQKVLGYTEWRNFNVSIEKAKQSCKSSNNNVLNHFVDVNKMIEIGKGGFRKVLDYNLSRYACYLIVMNADPKKEIIALGQTYFAIKTRQQELIENYNELSENEKRLSIRNELKKHNKSLAEAAQMAGVNKGVEYAIFQNHGYQGLYGGETAQDIKNRKGLKKSQHILDHMGSTELAANLFRATQTDEKLRREKISNKNEANKAHYEVGAKVRQTIKELGGTMPENLPTPKTSVKQIEKEEAKKITTDKKD